MAQTPEGVIKQRAVKLLKSVNAYYFFPATGGYGRSGVPDIIGCVGGMFFGIECKAPGKQPTALQTQSIHNIRKAGGIAFVYDGSISDDEFKLRLGCSGVIEAWRNIL
jgi:hypothetical protein